MSLCPVLSCFRFLHVALILLGPRTSGTRWPLAFKDCLYKQPGMENRGSHWV